LVEKNPVAAVDKIKVVDAAPEIFTPEQLARLLNVAPAELLPALAIQAFAGLRTSEVLRLAWGELDQTRGFITVSAKKAKTAKRRLIPVAPNLADWLRPYASVKGSLWAKGFRAYHVAIRNLATEIGLARWPNNGLRHSFASYHLAKHQNAPQLALEMDIRRLGWSSTTTARSSRRRRQKGTGSFAQPLSAAISSRIRPRYKPEGGVVSRTIKVKISV
jgi:integrase